MQWLLRNVRLADGVPLVDIAVDAGQIASIGPTQKVDAEQVWDLDGRVVLPGLIDAHTHLDKTYLNVQNLSGTLHEAIDQWGMAKGTRGREQVLAAARRALITAIANGVTAMRSHVDTSVAADLDTLETLLSLRGEMAGLIDLQFVALGNISAGEEARRTMREALSMGADCVGGAPSLTDEPRSSIDQIFALAQETGKPIDLHIDETEDPRMLALEYLAEVTIDSGMQGMVTAGHCCSLGFVDELTAVRVIDRVAEAGIHVITLPSCNLVLMGRGMHPAPRGITPVTALLARGVSVSAASDNVGDPFNPFGAYDPLQIAQLNAQVAHMSSEAGLRASLEMVTRTPAQVLGLNVGTIAVGRQADLVVLDTRQAADAVLCPPPRLATFKAGRLIVQTEIGRKWHDARLERES